MPSADQTPSDAPKYSRYRRRTAETEAPHLPVVEVEVKQPKDESITRSMSRYRRPRFVHKIDPNDTPTIPEVPQNSRQVHSQSVSAGSRPIELRQPVRRGTDPLARLGEDGVHNQYEEIEAERLRRKARIAVEEGDRRVTEREAQHAQNQRGAETEGLQKRSGETDAERRRKARKVLEEEEQREAALEAAQDERNRRVAEQEAERRLAEQLAEQKKKDLERLEAELEAAPPIQRVSSPREKLRFFSRKKKPVSPTSPQGAGGSTGFLGLGRSQVKGGDTRSNGSSQPVETVRSTQKNDHSRKVEPPKITNAIVQGGGGIVPQTDAPISASNAGERRVLVRCNQSSINLPITPETTPVELIYSAANIMNQHISISTAIIIETYTQVGLERRVRRYEHVRDILNSWDRDTQNSLLIENPLSPNSDLDLEVSHGANYTPADFSVYMYHSQKPGKWNKRHITLLANGQMYIAKKPDASLSDKDVVTICHLSDFDIYTPTSHQSRKVIKPPKKHCYAIKSQQKTAMFLSTENFVHFFSADDRNLAEKFYETIQRWRSWYLVTQKGEGKQSSLGKDVKKAPSGFLSRSDNRVSVDAHPYTIGSFQPLINSDRFGSAPDRRSTSDEDAPLLIPHHLRAGTTSPPKRDSKHYPPTVNYKIPGAALDEFASAGLLGRTYSQRQQHPKDHDGPFTSGPSLLNNIPSSHHHHRSLSVKSTKRPDTSGSGLQRNGSLRQKPKPLLDFTPTFKEAPQWDKTNKGHGVKAIEGVPLVEVATGPENSGLSGMPGTLFRREPLGGGPLRPTTSR